MEFQAITGRLQSNLSDAIIVVESDAIDPWIEVAADRWIDVAVVLRDDTDLAFDFLNCISGVDYFHTDPKKAAKVDWEPHLEVVYHLSCLQHKHRMVVKVNLPRWKEDREAELPELPSVASIWRTADWHEREVYDLVGVRFIDHPNMRRILCPEDWVGHPLRKDYEMPLEYHGIRGR